MLAPRALNTTKNPINFCLTYLSPVPKEFIQFLFISKSSGAEVQSHLYVAFDQGYLDKKTFESIYAQAEKVSKMCSCFIKYLNTQLNKPKQPK